MSHRHSRRRGSALVVVVALATVTLLVIVASLTESTAATQYAGQGVREARLRYACEAALAYYREQIAFPQHAGRPYTGAPVSTDPLAPGPPFTSGTPPGYTGNANQWLRFYGSSQNTWLPLFPPRASSSALPLPSIVVNATTASGVPLPGIPVWCWINDVSLDVNGDPLPTGLSIAGDDYRLAAYAELPLSGSANPAVASSDRILLIEDLRESQPFSSYMFFTFSNDLRIGNVTVNGSIHSNARIIFPATGNTIVTGKASATGGFYQETGSGPITAWTNTGVQLGSSQSGGAPVPLPATGVASEDQIAVAGAGSSGSAPGPKFYSVKKGSGQFTGWNGLSGPNINATITVNNTAPPTFDITATGSTGGSVTYTSVPFPDKGVIYVDGNVTFDAPSGFSGKLTVVAGNGDLTVNTNVQYKDPNPSAPANTQYAYNLVDPSSGTVLDPATTTGSWAGYQYQPNASYSGPATSLGLMAYNSVKSSASAPNNLLVNASIYAYQGSPFDAVTAGATKGNLVIGGSLVGNTTGGRTNGVVGYTQSGLYAFDQKASRSPPPGWLSTPAPAFGAIHRRSPYAVPGSFIHDGTNTTAGGAGD